MSTEFKSPETDPELKLIQEAIDLLSEHFDSVHIFTTRHESDETGTYSIQRGSGNWWARIGAIKAWIIRNDAEELEKGRQDQNDRD